MNNPVQRINQLESGIEDIMLPENNKDKDIISILGMKSKLNDINQMRNKLIGQEHMVIDNDEVLNILEERIKNMTTFQIKNLSSKQIEDIYTINNEKIELVIEMDSEERKISFMRDFLLFKKNSSVALKQMDKSIETLETELKKGDEEFNKIINEYDDIQTLIKTRLVDAINNSTNEDMRKRNTQILDSFNDALTLNEIFEHYKTQKVLNTVHDYKMRSDSIYTKYVRTCKHLGIKSDITIFNNLEIKFLPEKYHKIPNLFLFSVIKYFAYKKNCNKHIDGIFLSQFLVNVKNLFCDKFKDINEKQTFIESIMKVLDLFY